VLVSRYSHDTSGWIQLRKSAHSDCPLCPGILLLHILVISLSIWSCRKQDDSSSFQSEKIRSFDGNTTSIRSLQFSKDGACAISVSDNLYEGNDSLGETYCNLDDTSMRICYWDVEKGRKIRELDAIPPFVESASFAMNDRLIIGGDENGYITVWDAESGSIVKKFVGHQGGVTCLGETPDGKLFSAGRDGAVRTWSLDIFLETGHIPAHKDMVCAVAVAGNGRVVTTGERYRRPCRVWSGIPGQCLATIQGNATGEVAISSDSGFIAFASGRNTLVYRLNADGSYSLWQKIPDVQSQEFFPNGKYLVVGGSVLEIWDIEQRTRVWRLETFRFKKSLVGMILQPGVTSLAVSNNGELLLVGFSNGVIDLYKRGHASSKKEESQEKK